MILRPGSLTAKPPAIRGLMARQWEVACARPEIVFHFFAVVFLSLSCFAYTVASSTIIMIMVMVGVDAEI